MQSQAPKLEFRCQLDERDLVIFLSQLLFSH